ncbi:MAG: response regulator [Deltaproteobacteria bacterium]|nr:response regulator [Deltaproteobacteria bacterium]
MKEYSSILLVDDDDTFRERLAKALRKRSLIVSTASSVSDALSLLPKIDPEFAIIDLKMPGADGLELADSLVRQNPEIKIVILTGFGSITTAVRAISIGCINYITKPADVDTILGAFSGSDNQTEIQPPSLAEVEWEHIQRVLEDNSGNITQTAKALGIHRRSLQRKLSTVR